MYDKDVLTLPEADGRFNRIMNKEEQK